MSMAPGDDAEEQADGSFLQRLGDGTTLRYTQRKDGSWRKPERIRSSASRSVAAGTSSTKGATTFQKELEQELKRVLKRKNSLNNKITSLKEL